jgi:hypothetical protein
MTCQPGELDECRGSGNVGLCRNGTSLCDSNGVPGVCTGYIDPTSEVCDGKDNDCNGQVDNGNGVLITYYYDNDLDGHCSSTTTGCSDPDGAGAHWLTSCPLNDCDDNAAWNYPGNTEACDDRDNNCNGSVDETFTTKGAYCTNGVGACARQGNLVCNSAQNDVTCNAVPGSPQGCGAPSGTDWNCDGVIEVCSKPTQVDCSVSQHDAANTYCQNTAASLVGAGMTWPDACALAGNPSFNPRLQCTSNGGPGCYGGFPSTVFYVGCTYFSIYPGVNVCTSTGETLDSVQCR